MRPELHNVLTRVRVGRGKDGDKPIIEQGAYVVWHVDGAPRRFPGTGRPSLFRRDDTLADLHGSCATDPHDCDCPAPRC